MLIGTNEQYLQVAFDNEAEIEGVVAENYELLFGSTSVYIPQKMIKTRGGRATKPDAFVIDLERSEWYIVEVERAHHGTWDHIAPQVSKQLAAVANEDTREQILKGALEAIGKSEDLKEALSELGVDELSVHGRLSGILKKLPVVAIPIDDIPDDLEEWARTLKHDVKIWQIGKYVEDSSNRVLYLLPEDATPRIDTKQDHDAIPETRFEGGKALRQVLDAGLLKPGDELWMEYQPRGLTKQRFTATVRRDGLELDGRVYSPSYAAVACMKKAGSTRKTANGWMRWHTQDGRLLNDVAQSIPPDREDPPIL